MAADRNNDDIAAALHGLSAGDHASESTQGQPVVPPAPVAPPAQPAKSRVAPPPAAKRPATPVARPAVPAPPPPSRTPVAPQPRPVPGRGRPATPMRPATPGELQAAPQEHYAPEHHAQVEPEATSAAQFSPARKTPVSHTLGFRRTVIPILLTTGVMMLLMGAARWFVDEEATLARLPLWVAIILLLTGAASLLLGVANMLFVHSELKKATRVA